MRRLSILVVRGVVRLGRNITVFGQECRQVFMLHPAVTMICQMVTIALLVAAFVFFSIHYRDLYAVLFQATIAQCCGFVVAIVTYAWNLRTVDLPFAPRYLPWVLVGSIATSMALVLVAYVNRLTIGPDGPAAYFFVACLVTAMVGTYGCYSAARGIACLIRDQPG